jgi:hypothetical protein
MLKKQMQDHKSEVIAHIGESKYNEEMNTLEHME